MCSILFLVDQFIFVFAKLSLDDFFYQVNGYVHIRTNFFRTNDASFHRNRNLDLLTVFLRAQRNMYFCRIGKVSFEFADLFFNGRT